MSRRPGRPARCPVRPQPPRLSPTWRARSPTAPRSHLDGRVAGFLALILNPLAILSTIFALLVLFLHESPKMGRWLLDLMPPERSAYCRRVAGEISQSVSGYAFGNLLTSLIAGLVVFVTLAVLGVPTAAVGGVGGAGGFPAHDRRRAGRHPHGPVRPWATHSPPASSPLPRSSPASRSRTTC